MASRSRAPMARQALLLHNILFDLLLPDSFDQGAPKYLLYARELGSLMGWRERGASGTGIPLALPGLLPAPGFLHGHFGTRS